jgi:hypothetical protein
LQSFRREKAIKSPHGKKALSSAIVVLANVIETHGEK